MGDVTISVPLDGDGDDMPDEWEFENGLDPSSADDSGLDPDEDGLSNLAEYQNGTDPTNWDTDNDYMADGWEVSYDGLDPLTYDALVDLDGDGYSNFEEYFYGTDPNDSNSKPQPPIADAGPDQTVDEGVVVTLDGSNSTDPNDGISSYLWEQTEGIEVTLSASTAVQPTFTAPEDVAAGGESLTFQLTVTDNEGLPPTTDTCIVNVTWNNIPPTADAGPDQTVDEGETVTLDGSNSTDPDVTIASYLWTQTGGTPVTLSDTTDAMPTFVALPVDVSGETLTFQLTVKDNGGLEGSDEVLVTVNDNGITGFPDDVVTMTSSTGESIGIKVDSGGNCASLSAIDPSTIADTTNGPEDLIYGLIDIQIKTHTVGGTAFLTIYLPDPAPYGYKWYKYVANTGWYDYSEYAVFNFDRTQLALKLIDGGIGDDDGVADRMIVDPCGLGIIALQTEPAPTKTSPTPSAAGGGGGGCFIATAAYGSSIGSHVKVLSQFRDRFLLTNRMGKVFVRFYYTYSPPVADFIASHDMVRLVARSGLWPLVGVSWMALQLGPIATLALIVLLLALMSTTTTVACLKRLWLK
jgi:hypothetical protein